MRRLLTWTLALITLCAVLVIAPRLIGARAKPPGVVAFLDPGNCPQSCWRGIRPGTTTLRQTKALFQANNTPISDADDNYYDFCWLPGPAFALRGCARKDPEGYERGDYLIHSLYVMLPVNSLRLGDALVLFGLPSWVEVCEYPGVLVKFASGVKIALNGDMYGKPLRLDTPVEAIIYSVPDDSHDGDDRWRGFTEHIQCQLE